MPSFTLILSQEGSGYARSLSLAFYSSYFADATKMSCYWLTTGGSVQQQSEF